MNTKAILLFLLGPLWTAIFYPDSNVQEYKMDYRQLKPENGADTINPMMITVDSGSFLMGSLVATDFHQSITIAGSHKVFLSSYKIGKYEVSQAEWKAVMGANISLHQDCDDCPVEEVSWSDVQIFISALNKKTGRHYALPTAAQWEFAARGGSKDKGYSYSGSDEVDKVAWYGKEFIDKTHPVGRKLPNQLGIYDMSGNVAELCSDWFEQYPDDATQTNPKGPSSGNGHIMRGGSWGNNPSQCGVLYGSIVYPNDRNAHVGFRLALLP